MFVLTDLPIMVLIGLCIAVGACIGIVYEHKRIMDRFKEVMQEEDYEKLEE